LSFVVFIILNSKRGFGEHISYIEKKTIETSYLYLEDNLSPVVRYFIFADVPSVFCDVPSNVCRVFGDVLFGFLLVVLCWGISLLEPTLSYSFLTTPEITTYQIRLGYYAYNIIII
jgi:hypothetical protein